MSKKKKKQPLKGKKVLREVNLDLTPVEKAERATEAAQLSQEIDTLEIQKKMATDEFSAKLKDRRARVKTLLKEVHTGKEIKEVECLEVRNFDKEEVEYWHKKKLVDTRDMEDADLQEEMPLKASKAAEKAVAGVVKAAKDAGHAVVADGVPTEDKACVAIPGKKPPRGKRQEIDPEIASVMREETGRRTKSSAVDGARA